MKKMKAFTLGLAAVMAMSVLGGCTPGSAKSVVKQYAKEDHDNYHASGNISLGMTFTYSGMSIALPLDVAVDFDSEGETLYGNLDVKMEDTLWDEISEESMNFYAVKSDKEPVLYQDASGSWEYSKLSLGDKNGGSLPKMLKDTKWSSFEKTDSGYTIQTDLSSVKGVLKINVNSALVSVLDSLQEGISEDMLDGMEGGTVTCSFDKDLNLVSMTLQDYTGQVEESEDIPGLQLDVSMNLTFSDFGGVGEIELPEEVSGCEQGDFDFLDLLNL